MNLDESNILRVLVSDTCATITLKFNVSGEIKLPLITFVIVIIYTTDLFGIKNLFIPVLLPNTKVRLDGIEPPQTDLESGALPLYYSPAAN